MGESKLDKILCSTFVSITEHITGVTFTSIEEKPFEKELYTIRSKMNGGITGDIVFYIPKKFADKVVDVMKTDDEISYDDILMEYVNILFGRMLSCASNYLGKYARFKPPIVKWTDEPEAETLDTYTEMKRYCFESDYGIVRFRANYTIV